MVIELPIYDPDPNRTRKRTQRILIAEGRAARRAGLPKTACPAFKVADMAIDWKCGWRWEDERIRNIEGASQ